MTVQRNPQKPINEVQRALFRASVSIQAGEWSLEQAKELLELAQSMADAIEDFYDCSGWGSRHSVVSSIRNLLSDLEEFDPNDGLRGTSLGRNL